LEYMTWSLYKKTVMSIQKKKIVEKLLHILNINRSHSIMRIINELKIERFISEYFIEKVINRLEITGGNWASYEGRWHYHKHAIEIIEKTNINDSSKVLEMGTLGINLVLGSDTIDYDERWNYPGQSPTYLHDARNLPWPINDKQYELFIALRVFQHLIPVQKECFMEALRIADNVLIVVPEYYLPEGEGITLQQFVEWNNGILPTIVQNILDDTNLYYWSKDDLVR
jgi:hypothetical protein